MRFMLTAAAILVTPGPALAQLPDSLPAGVTSAMIAEGARLYAGPGICIACHGPDAQGVRNLGPDLTDAEWLHGDGTFAAIVERILAGVPASESKTGVVMPPRGGSALTDQQVRAVAAYVWSRRASTRD